MQILLPFSKERDMQNQNQISKQTNENKRKRGPRSVHIFDSVFRVICEKMPKLLIPLINEAFGTSYSDDETFEQLRNERHLDDKKIITDALIKICGHLYHIECQSTDSDFMILRMFEYDASIALENWSETPEGFEITFPTACVVYLRGKDKAERNKKLRVKFPNGESFDYRVKIIEIQKYSKNELFKKKLLMFLPYYILRYEDNLPLKKNKERFNRLIKEYKDIIGSLEDALPGDQEGYRRRLLELINKISKYVTRNRKALKKGLGDIMGGRVLKLETDRIIEESEARGRNNAIYVCFRNCMNRGMSFEDAKALSGASDEAALAHYQRWLKEMK